MKISSLFFINIKKLKNQMKKALFLIIPITLIVMLATIITSHTANFQKAASEAILGTAQEQNTILKIEKTIEFPGGMGGSQSSPTSSGNSGSSSNSQSRSFSEYDLNIINAIEHVKATQMTSSLPISNATIDGIFDDTTISANSIVGIDAEMASLYTDQDFTYSEGEAIPVILNASTFTKTYEEWNGQEEITIDMSAMGQPGSRGDMTQEEMDTTRENLENQMPIKTQALDYNESELIGKEIELSINGLDDLATYTISMSSEGMVFTKVSEDQLATSEQTRQDSISQYWDYDKLNEAITYKLVVVGVIESQQDSSTYIPTEAANQIMTDYIQREIDARTTDVPIDELNAVYNGLSYDGYELESDQTEQIMRNAQFGAQGNGAMMMGRPDESSQTSGNATSIEFTDTESYNIPGLVIEVDADTGDVIGQYSDATVYKSSAKSSQTILVKIDSISNRDDVVSAINDAGYSYQDFNNLEMFGSIDQTLQTITISISIAFIVLSMGVIIITMSKFVSESKKEIGIFRAIGMTKSGIRTLFVSQAAIYTMIGYLIGAVLGIVLAISISGLIYNWFNSAISNTVGQGFEVVNTIESSIFMNISWSSLGIYTLILAAITILVSLIPANQASKISPVEALLSE